MVRTKIEMPATVVPLLMPRQKLSATGQREPVVVDEEKSRGATAVMRALMTEAIASSLAHPLLVLLMLLQETPKMKGLNQGARTTAVEQVCHRHHHRRCRRALLPTPATGRWPNA